MFTEVSIESVFGLGIITGFALAVVIEVACALFNKYVYISED